MHRHLMVLFVLLIPSLAAWRVKKSSEIRVHERRSVTRRFFICARNPLSETCTRLVEDLAGDRLF